MLKEITIENFKSICNETTLSLEADSKRVSELKEHLVDINGNKLLRVCSIYGPNGGGKSNVLDAIMLLKLVVLRGRRRGEDSNLSCVFNSEKEITIRAFFVNENYKLGYQIIFIPVKVNPIDDERRVFGRTGMIKFEIVSEMLFVERNKSYVKLFERDSKGQIESEMVDLVDLKLTNLGNTVSTIRFLYENFCNTMIKLPPTLDCVKSFVSEISSIKTLSGEMRYLIEADFINNNKEKLIKLMNSVDVPIFDIKAEKREFGDEIFFGRNIKNKGVENLKYLPFNSESMGTQKIFSLFYSLIANSNSQNIYLADDLNAFLHPKLMKEIIGLINSSNFGTTQLIFNSHDIINMNNEVFRRDEIWFAFRDGDYSTRLVPLSNITNYKGEQIRNDASYSKQYLEGKYGADPYIKKGLDWNE